MKEFRKSIYRESQEIIIPPSDCKFANVTISAVDAEDSDDGTVWVDYTGCDGNPHSQQYPDAGTYLNSLCVDAGTSYASYYFKGMASFNAGSTIFEITGTNC